MGALFGTLTPLMAEPPDMHFANPTPKSKGLPA
jgi:hypothetical protein